MFKFLKYIFLLNIYKKTKKDSIIFLTSIVLLFLFSFMINDFIDATHSTSKYTLINVKWITIVVLLGLIVYSVLRIFTIVIASLSLKDDTPKKKNHKKEKVIAKEELFTKSDLIFKKYKS